MPIRQWVSDPYEGARGRNPYNGRDVTISTAYRSIVGGSVFFSDDWDYYWVTPKGSSKEHGYTRQPVPSPLTVVSIKTVGVSPAVMLS